MKLAKRLKKEKVNVDIINFGEEVSGGGRGPWAGGWLRCGPCQAGSRVLRALPQEVNTEKLTAFVNTLNGKDGTGSHLVTVPPGPSLADALISSPILAGEGGAMLGLGASDFEFGVDPSADPELALVSPRWPLPTLGLPSLSALASTRSWILLLCPGYSWSNFSRLLSSAF